MGTGVSFFSFSSCGETMGGDFIVVYKRPIGIDTRLPETGSLGTRREAAQLHQHSD
jgi:hypothetical protein